MSSIPNGLQASLIECAMCDSGRRTCTRGMQFTVELRLQAACTSGSVDQADDFKAQSNGGGDEIQNKTEGSPHYTFLRQEYFRDAQPNCIAHGNIKY